MWEIFVQYKDRDGKMLGRSECEASNPSKTLELILADLRHSNIALGATITIQIRRHTSSQMDAMIDVESGIHDVVEEV